MSRTAEHREDGVLPTSELKVVVGAAYAALKLRAAKIDALNVYPVPDGDTGTNMLLTLRSVMEAVAASPDLRGEDAAKAVSRAALMGARGNSGVILSQILRGACEKLGHATSLDAKTLAEALGGAKERAYSAVREPVEGTMLSVVKDAAAAAQAFVEGGKSDPVEVLREAARAAHESVRRTPELLRVLREAGVVDAGGYGVAVILDSLRASLAGEAPDLEDDDESVPDEDLLRDKVEHSAEEAWGYCTEFVVSGFSGDPDEFASWIHDVGKSVLVIPDEDLVKVHLHTQDPGGAISYAGSFGRLSGVKVDDMEAQTRARADHEDAAPTSELGVVVASRGSGNRAFFEGMGAVVVEGGQGANPSTEDFVRAVAQTGARSVILLPNNKNVVPTAEQVAGLVDVGVEVVPTHTIVAGLAAMVGYDAEGEPEEVIEEMRDIVSGLRCGEVTQAVREARVSGREVPEGAYIGLLDGELVAVEQGVEDAAMRLVERMLEEGPDVVTLLRGYGMDEGSARKVAERIRSLDGSVEIEVKDGGQPLYPLQMVAE
ncbi:MAG: Dihydroxyacetone kinase-like protein, phosphatase domain / Dihydroxyacetone kinase-like protein, kinase domain [uncultured Rubrobacteraceae bacterium]|uniref:Dihydroxyacetone kinase-like protein, phosphatase domain / Dihydroxyacetone kinase-like protein, kinase domain n=1 Tax=uncultured Rubrobacteraceae bacterium TaxID=349277 RepID=A0A6J4RHW1_9ACTN|nr:MAG: Dihydroxyacetone kinase-like protein, phosphatase domain / Dihydroxyacetone kinase-like protein, kinase domain [uncultured Rubrobacteraceae bacterium]